MKTIVAAALPALTTLHTASAEIIAEINGNRFLSPFNGQTVNNVTGLVTAKGSTGVFLRSIDPDSNFRTSESIFVFSYNAFSNVVKGDIISLSGNVTEYRSSSSYLYLTEISGPQNVEVQSSGNVVEPVVLGERTSGLIGTRNLSPPTEQYTSLDDGDVFGTPNNQSLISDVNPVLQPNRYGLDFWESLSGEYVEIRNVTVLDVPNVYGDVWVVGDWTTSGANDRGGLTITNRDGNPEAILIQDPLDGTDNALDFKLGDTLADITGVVTYAFGFYTIRPDTAVELTASREPAEYPATSLIQTDGCQAFTISDYNVENLTPTSDHLQALASQIVNKLQSPTVLFLQEIQDNDGATDDGVVAANQTLNTLIDMIQSAGGPEYSFAEISPVDDTTGGQPGGNIRNAYLFNPQLVRLRDATGHGAGGPRQPDVVQSRAGGPALKFNPGLIFPNNVAFTDSRRPLIAMWEDLNGNNPFFTVNIHGTSKGGSTSLHGDPRPPVNLGLDQRVAEARATARIIKNILNIDANARIIAAGDWNEFQFVKSQTNFVSMSGLRDLDDAAGTPANELYTYLYVQNSQALDHIYVSPRIADRSPKVEHVHINTWSNYDNRISDHDPSVALLNLCG